MNNTGLVLEGGGMRGLYTSGVLDLFMEKGLYFPYIIGVSAGACNALSYLSRQKGRSRKINIDYATDPRYMNYINLLKGKGLFDMDFIFDDIPNDLIPFDYETFHDATERLIVPATDCRTGQPVYFEKDQCRDVYSAVKASSSLPFVGKMVDLEGEILLDGGIADPIPIVKAMDDGNQRNVIVLTRDRNYRKEHFRGKFITEFFYSEYEGLHHALTHRHEVYNKTLDYIEELEAEGKVFVIRPKDPVEIKRLERDTDRLQELYMKGYHEAALSYEALSLWMKKGKIESRSSKHIINNKGDVKYMEELKTKFKELSKEQKIEFMKAIMPEMCKEFGDDPTQIMNELMPVCQDMMKNCNMDMRKMMSMMQK